MRTVAWHDALLSRYAPADPERESMSRLAELVRAMASDDAGLGLRYGEVVVTDHNPAWAAIFDKLAAEINRALAGLAVDVEHVGSTAVPGLVAKPIIDVAVGVEASTDNVRVVAALTEAGFAFRGDLGDHGGLLFVLESDPEIVVAHIHVVELNGFQWRWYLAFRDGLRSRNRLRGQYESLKRGIAETHAKDRDGYSQAKFDWVLSTVRKLDPNRPE